MSHQGAQWRFPALYCWWLMQGCWTQCWVLLSCQPGRCTATAPSSQGGAFWLKKRRTAGMEMGRKQHAATGRGCICGGLLKMRLTSVVFLLLEKKKHAAVLPTCLTVWIQFKKDLFLLILFKAVWNQNLLLSEPKERHWFYRGLTGRRIRCSLSRC